MAKIDYRTENGRTNGVDRGIEYFQTFQCRQQLYGQVSYKLEMAIFFAWAEIATARKAQGPRYISELHPNEGFRYTRSLAPLEILPSTGRVTDVLASIIYYVAA